MYSLLFVGFLAVHFCYGIPGLDEQKNKQRQEYLRALEKYKRETRDHELQNGLVCEIHEYPKEYKMDRTCWGARSGRRSGSVSTVEQKNKQRQEYLKALEKYKKETRVHELQNGLVCEIHEYPKEFKMDRTCWGLGRRSGPVSPDV